MQINNWINQWKRDAPPYSSVLTIRRNHENRNSVIGKYHIIVSGKSTKISGWYYSEKQDVYIVSQVSSNRRLILK